MTNDKIRNVAELNARFNEQFECLDGSRCAYVEVPCLENAIGVPPVARLTHSILAFGSIVDDEASVCQAAWNHIIEALQRYADETGSEINNVLEPGIFTLFWRRRPEYVFREEQPNWSDFDVGGRTQEMCEDQGIAFVPAESGVTPAHWLLRMRFCIAGVRINSMEGNHHFLY